MEPILKAYIQEAIEVEKAGLKVNYKHGKHGFISVPAEWSSKYHQRGVCPTLLQSGYGRSFTHK